MTDQTPDDDRPLDSVADAVEAIARGEMVIVVDDEDRENEGDLILAASRTSPEQMAFMVRHTSGIICAPMEPARAKALHLTPMVNENDAPLSTAFTVSVDYKHGLTTGISAEERCNTVLALANSNVSSGDFVRPGHVFPLIAREGGVLVRSGHTEAAVDLARLAGQPPVGVIGEIVNDDGTVKRLPELKRFAREHDLKIISIAELIAYRQMREHLVERTAEFTLQTVVGPVSAIAYRTRFDPTEHLALLIGEARPAEPTLVRIHRERLLEDVFGPQGEFENTLVHTTLKHMAGSGGGVFLYLRRGQGVVSPEPEETGSETTRQRQWLEVGVGAQILRDLGIDRIRLLAGRPHNYVGLRGFGIELVETQLLSEHP